MVELHHALGISLRHKLEHVASTLATSTLGRIATLVILRNDRISHILHGWLVVLSTLHTQSF